MAIEIRWLVSTAVSALHAAEALLGGVKLVDAKLTAALAEEVAGLRDDLAVIRVEPKAIFEHLIPNSVRFDVPHQLAEMSLGKVLGPHLVDPDAAVRLSHRVKALEGVFGQLYPNALEELELRSEPLRSQWEARGPGLMAAVARLTERDLVVAQADAILVQPVLGGGGAAHWLYNSIHFEAVLANPIADLPEVVRLGWLLAQLNLDLPMYQGDLHRNRLLEVGPLAMIPPLLAAAEEVELARNSGQTLATALAAWSIGSGRNMSEVEPGQLSEWWESYQTDNPTWTVALGALDQMLGAESPNATTERAPAEE